MAESKGAQDPVITVNSSNILGTIEKGCGPRQISIALLLRWKVLG
jgi:hypothetical protein